MRRDVRYTLGAKIDALLVETIEASFSAAYLSREKKIPFLERAVTKLDAAKFFLQILWEIGAVDAKHYADLSLKLNDIGKMLGGWVRGLQK